MKIKWFWKSAACSAFITLFITIVMIVAFMPSASFAEEGGDDPDDIEWNTREMHCLSDWDILYSDGDLPFSINDVELPEGMSVNDLKVSIGRYDEAADKMEWDAWEMQTPGLYAFSEGAGGNELILTMNGAAAKAAGAKPYEWVELSVVCDNGSDGEDLEIIWSAHCGFEYREPSVEYWPNEDRDILPGWDGTVDGWIRVRVEDAEHPGDGNEWDIPADNITLVSGGSLFSNEHIDSEGDGSERIWYYYRAKDPQEKQYGTAVFNVEYTDLENNRQTAEVKVNVVSDIYRVNVRSLDGRYTGLPGNQFELKANASHEYYVENGDGWYDYVNDTEGLNYEWEVTRGEDFADLVTDNGDPSKATVTLKLPAGYDTERGFWEDIDVECRIYDESEEFKTSDWRRLNIADGYMEVFPALIDDMEVGASTSVTPELRMYPGSDGKEYDTIEGVSYEWYYDSNAVSITDKNGNAVGNRDEHDQYIGSDDPQKFTITRLRDWDTNINLEADWDEGHHHFEYHIDGVECRIDDICHDRDVYTDEEEAPSVEFDTYLGANWQERIDVDLTVGTWNGRTDTWDEVYENTPEKRYYTAQMTDDKVTVTLEDSFFRDISDYTDIRVLGEVYLKGAERDPDNRLSETDSWLHIKPAMTDYYRFEDCDLLTARDEINIDHYFRVRVENSQYPDGEEFDCEVTDVDIVEETAVTDGKKVIRNFRKDCRDNDQTSNDYWWHMEAATPGTARIKVTFNDPEELGGKTGNTYEFTVTVTDDVYEVWINSADGRDKGQPGTTIELIANAMHRTKQGDTTEGLSYEWEVVNGNEFADLITDSGDPSKAAVTLKIPAGYNTDYGYWEDIDVECRIYDGSEEVRARDSRRLNLADSYTEVFPALIDDMEVGATASVTPELRMYPGTDGKEYDTIEGASFEWYYDSNAVAIRDEDGNTVGNRDDQGRYIGSDEPQTFTITRLREWDTDFELCAVWDDGRDEREEWRHYWFSWKNLELRSMEHDVWISTDTAAEDIPEAIFEASLGDDWQSRLDVTIKAGFWDGEADDWAGECFDTGENGDFVIRKTDNEIGVSISEELLRSFADEGPKDIRVVAEAYPKGLADSDLVGENRLADGDLWIHVFDPEVRYLRMDFFELVKGDKITIPEYDFAWVRDTGHPHGGLEQFKITGVSIDGDSDAVTITEISDGGKAWVIEAADTGETKIKVEYEAFSGEAESAPLRIRVKDEVTYAELRAEDNVRNVTPGSAAKLISKVYKHTSGEDDVEITNSGDLSFNWSLIEGSEFADISGNGNEATVSFKDTDREWFDECVRVELVIKSGDKEIWIDEYEFRYVNECDRISGAVIYPDLHVGASVTVTPEARHYPSVSGASAGFDVASDATFEWEYDNSVISIEEKNGSYVIKRIGRADTTLILRASWEDSEGYERYAEEWYDLFGDAECDHEYGDTEYVWAADNSTVTATRICIYDGAVDSESVSTTAAITDPTCESAGKKVYTAAFRNEAFSVQTKEEAGEPALGHDLTKIDAKEATTEAAGNIEYYKCNRCGKIFSDAEGRIEIDEAATVTPKKEDVQPQPQPDPQPQPQPDPQPQPAVTEGQTVTSGGSTYVVTSVANKTAALAKAKNAKKVTVAGTVNIEGESYKVTAINANAFKGAKIRSIVIGKNVSKINKNAFKGSKATTITVKTKLLKKAGVKGSLKGSKIKTVTIKIGSKAVNKKFVKSYKKIFTKAIAGKKVTVK